MCSLYLYSTMIYEPDFKFINTQIIAARTHVDWALTECRILRKWLNLNTNNVVVVGMRRSTQAVYDSWASFQFSQRCTSRKKWTSCNFAVRKLRTSELARVWFCWHIPDGAIFWDIPCFPFFLHLRAPLYSCTIIYEPDFNCNTQTISARIGNSILKDSLVQPTNSYDIGVTR